MNADWISPEQKSLFRKKAIEEQNDAPLSLEYNGTGKVAERIRRIDDYRNSKNILVSLHPSLRQTCLNVLADQKKLLIPTPGLQKGFMLVSPTSVPPQKRKLAIRPIPNNPFGRKMPYEEPFQGLVDLIITEAFLLGRDGTRMGDGSGHLDIQCAILSSLGWLSPDVRVLAVADDRQIVPSVPVEKTDVRIHWIVTPTQVLAASHDEPFSCEISWEKLSKKQIRRNEALYFLNRRRLISLPH
ncbi:5-formyltetrahydrofolate cyclo-ligase [Desulforhabdus amnigena]|uniref:5-formyltetrahydrofolate cyclo-ligase n=1 Tax=Desulforhabdus amnigena TaxID=40218 RepID=A0A9W6CYN8_9BACT|nr:5-formyltetrahydrofolate cyclo-ligase [Desulforhabdus amnigena]NLJ29214.1 hypothetical protein [Deltaproteobacteria bacterium]GLI34231.1 hypothetical protein DAMNIGENAA_16640 [Desulforhabdus amnigena]